MCGWNFYRNLKEWGSCSLFDSDHLYPMITSDSYYLW